MKMQAHFYPRYTGWTEQNGATGMPSSRYARAIGRVRVAKGSNQKPRSLDCVPSRRLGHICRAPSAENAHPDTILNCFKKRLPRNATSLFCI
jgi:hypothetical protein